MTATDELRRLLDEHGIEYCGGEIMTYTDDADYMPSASNTFDVTLYNLTPEQAVEATLGRGECERLQDENERLRSCLSDSAENAKQIMHEAHVQEEENAKLRELVRDMWTCIQTADKSDNAWDECPRCSLWNGNNNHRCEFGRRMKELGGESMTQTWEQAYYQSMSFCCTVRRCSSPQKIEKSWHRTFSCVASSLGFKKAARKTLWENLADGNWDHFNLTDEEKKLTSYEWLEALCLDVRYCSDCWTLDRLTRCHWKFRQYMYAVQKEAGVEA